MKTYYVYILKCSDNSFYTGVCNDLDRRYTEHKEGENTDCYTHSRRPIKLVYTEDFVNINEAIEREKQIKGWSRAKKIALIQKDWNKLILLSKSRHPSASSG